MNLVDRLIAKAQKIRLSYGDNVFIISNETGKWMAEGQEFPSFEAAQEYVESLLPDDLPDCAVIINDVPPSPVPEPEKKRKRKFEEWAAAVKAEKAKAENPLPPTPKKDRHLI